MEEKRTRGGEEERWRGRGEGRRGEKEKRRRELGEEVMRRGGVEWRWGGEVEERTRGGEEERRRVGEEETQGRRLRGGEAQVKRRIFSVQQNNHNGHIYIRVMQHIPILKCFFGENRKKKPLYVYAYVVKIGFSKFSQKVSFLRHMLISKSYINVIIAVILS